MNYFNKIRFVIIILSIMTLMVSCRKFVELGPPPNLIVSTEVFKDSTTASSTVLSVYTYLASGYYELIPFNGGITAYTGLLSDELVPGSIGSDDINTYFQNAMAPTMASTNPNFPWYTWYSGYEIMYRINACIEGLTASTSLKPSVKNRLLGESKFMRAFVYFHLVNLFGQVPLVTTTNFETNAVLPRATVESVYQQIKEDLLNAQELLPESYLTQGRVRVNKFVATALLGKVYLYQKDYIKAEEATSLVISNSAYSLESDLNKVFLPTSKEAIWQLVPLESGRNTAEAYAFVPSSSTIVPPYFINSYLLNSFEATDARKVNGNWLKTNTTPGGQTYAFPYKYKLPNSTGSSPTEYYMVLRLADQYLVRAEARVNLNKLSEAKNDLNMVRNRAMLPNSLASNQAELLESIFHERQVELFCEWGNRWFDLKRTGKINQVMSIVAPTKGGTWNENKQLLPIDKRHLDANISLTQNSGY